MSSETHAAESSAPSAWSPDLLAEVSREEVLFSRGFLRSRVELWFPNLSSLWVPLCHSLGAHLEVKSVQPVVGLPQLSHFHCLGTVDDEPFGVAFDHEAERAIQAIFGLSGNQDRASASLVEYLAERTVWSLASHWQVGDSAAIQIDASLTPSSFRPFSGVDVEFLLNERLCKIHMALGKLLTLKLDGLWRRQLLSQSRTLFPNGGVDVELTYLSIPTVELPQYLNVGALIDLEIGLSHDAQVAFSAEQVFHAQVRRSDNQLVVQVGQRNFDRVIVPPECTRVQVLLDQVELSIDDKVELAQPGAAFFLDRELSGRCSLVIDGKPVAEGLLNVYQSNLALRVVKTV